MILKFGTVSIIQTVHGWEEFENFSPSDNASAGLAYRIQCRQSMRENIFNGVK